LTFNIEDLQTNRHPSWYGKLNRSFRIKRIGIIIIQDNILCQRNAFILISNIARYPHIIYIPSLSTNITITAKNPTKLSYSGNITKFKNSFRPIKITWIDPSICRKRWSGIIVNFIRITAYRGNLSPIASVQTHLHQTTIPSVGLIGTMFFCAHPMIKFQLTIGANIHYGTYKCTISTTGIIRRTVTSKFHWINTVGSMITIWWTMPLIYKITAESNGFPCLVIGFKTVTESTNMN